MQVRLRFSRAGDPVEPHEQDLAALAARYTSLLARARFGHTFEVTLTPVADPAATKPEDLA